MNVCSRNSFSTLSISKSRFSLLIYDHTITLVCISIFKCTLSMVITSIMLVIDKFIRQFEAIWLFIKLCTSWRVAIKTIDEYEMSHFVHPISSILNNLFQFFFLMNFYPNKILHPRTFYWIVWYIIHQNHPIFICIYLCLSPCFLLSI